MKTLICKPEDSRVRDFLAFAKAKDKFIELNIHRERRTNDQNRYLHVVFTIFGDEFGYSLDESKQLLKEMFLSYEKVGKSGKTSKFFRKTSSLDTLEMTVFIEAVRKVASENGCFIPSPEDYYSNYKEIENKL
jgi:hypothetical protein